MSDCQLGNIANVAIPEEESSELRKRRLNPLTIRRYLSRVPYLILIGILIDLAVVHLSSGREGFHAILSLSVPYLILGVILAFIPWLTRSLRVMIWSRFFGNRIHPLRALRVILGTDIVAAATPTAVGGAPAKASMLYKEGFSPASSLVITTLAWIEDTLFFVIAVPAAIAVSPSIGIDTIVGLLGSFDPMIIVTILSLLVAAGILIFFAARREPGGNGLVARIYRGIKTWLARTKSQMLDAFAQVVKGGMSQLLLTMPLTAVQWTARYLIVSAVAFGLGLEVDPAHLFVLQCIVFALMVFVPLPGATVGAEGGFLLLHGGMVPLGTVGVLMTGWRFLTFHLPVAVAGVLLLILGRLLQDRRRDILDHRERPAPARAQDSPYVAER